MNRPINPASVVNKNDNHFVSWLRMGADQEHNQRMAAHIPKADYLIKMHATAWWKNHPSEWDYQFAQYKLCTVLDDFSTGAEFFSDKNVTINWCAMVLGIKPLALHNDPDLPF